MLIFRFLRRGRYIISYIHYDIIHARFSIGNVNRKHNVDVSDQFSFVRFLQSPVFRIRNYRDDDKGIRFVIIVRILYYIIFAHCHDDRSRSVGSSYILLYTPRGQPYGDIILYIQEVYQKITNLIYMLLLVISIQSNDYYTIDR